VFGSWFALVSVGSFLLGAATVAIFRFAARAPR